MEKNPKSIILSGHAKEQSIFRGCNKAEVIETIRTANWTHAELGRLECRKDLAFNQEWNGKFYTTKQIRPIFTEEKNKIVVVTVYVYYC